MRPRDSYKWMKTSLSLKGELLNKAIELAAVCTAAQSHGGIQQWASRQGDSMTGRLETPA
jgi:hypothetical protein